MITKTNVGIYSVMNAQRCDPNRVRLPLVRDLIEELTPQNNSWGWILKDPRCPELQYFVPYPMISYGPPVPPQRSVSGMSQIQNRTLPPLTTSPTPIFYYPVPLEQMTRDPNWTPRLPPIHPFPTLGPESQERTPPSLSMDKSRAPGPPATTPSSSHNSDIPASASPSEESREQTPETSPLEAHPEQSRREEPSPTPAQSTRPQRPITTISGRAPTIRIVQFLDVTAHTAKCDDCDRRNREGMIRCCICGWQCCRNCQTNRRGSRTHRSFQSVHVASQVEADDAAQNAAQSTAAGAIMRINRGPFPLVPRRGIRSHRMRSTSPRRRLDSDDTLSHRSFTEDSSDVAPRDYGGRERRNPPRGARPEGFAE